MTLKALLKQTATAIFALAATPCLAQSQSPAMIEIASQPLATAIAELSKETGLVIVSETSVLRGKTSRAVSGVLLPQDALLTMLHGTGLSLQSVDSQSVAILPPLGLVSQNAQTAQDDTPFALETLVISGELINRDLQDSQTSVAITTGEALERRNIISVVDLLSRTANAASAFGDDSISIRGIQDRGVGNAGTGRTITNTVDGARLTDFGLPATLLSTWDLEQVEVLRGPQSTQTGRNALAGSVIVRSRDPDYLPEYRLRFGLGEHNTRQASVVANTPLLDDRLALRFSADIRKTDGDISNPTRGIDDYDFSDETYLRAGLRWDPTDSFSAILKYSYSDVSDAGRASVSEPEFLDGERVNFFDVPEFSKRKLRSTNLRLFYDVSPGLTLESETTFTTFDRDNQTDSDFSETVTPAARGPAEGETIQQEIRLRYESATLRAVGGMFYTDVDSSSSIIATDIPAFFFDPSAPFDATADFSTDNRSETTNYAIFGEFEYEFAPRWTVIAGGRYDVEDTDVTSTVSLTSASDGVTLPPPNATRSSSRNNVFLPKLGLVYDLSQDSTLGFTVQKGYRSGGARVNTFVGAVPFDPEFTTNYELAYRASFNDDRLILNANAFYTDWQDQQILVARPGGTDNPNDTITANAGRSSLWGGELEIQAQPRDNLSLFASVGYANTRLDDFILNGEQLAGNAFPFAPEWTAAIGGTYDFRNGVYVSADANFTDSAYTDPQNTQALKIDSRTVVNLRVGYEADRWDFYAYAKNLFDEAYVTNRLTTGGLTVGDSREVGVVFQAQF